MICCVRVYTELFRKTPVEAALNVCSAADRSYRQYRVL